MKTYDVIVIGAGNAGLTATLELLTKGKKVLLIEQHNIPGGCATSFCRGRFEIEPSLHELCGVGSAENPAAVPG
ncbi:MAG: FAD-dependent oxidoreductase [Clostridia bacterium]|nr:FAD-dependent oxidoreductase [Clostridia bacterium]